MFNPWCGSHVEAIEKQNRQTSRSFILSEVIKSVGLNFLPAVLTGDRKKKKQFFLVTRQVLSSLKKKKSRKTKNWFNSTVCFLEMCCFRVYSRGLKITTQWGDTISSLSESCLSSNPVGKTTKTSSSKQVILQMHSICFSFKDMRSVKICCSPRQSPKTASCFESAPEVRDAISYRHSG